MANLFDYGDVKNHPRRSGFDLSRRRLFTAKVGELLPVYWRLTYPGDKFKLGVQHFTRTMPVNTAAFTRIREYYDWYWVPLRLINKNIGQALVNMVDNPVQASGLTSARQIVQDIPYSNLGVYSSSSFSLGSISFLLSAANGFYDSNPSIFNQFGFRVSACSAKLLKYLGYGSLLPTGMSGPFPVSSSGVYGLTTNTELDQYDVRAVNNNVNLLPLLAYQKIYADYFRFQQWENNEPWTYNADYYNGGNFFAPLTTLPTSYAYMSSNNVLTLRYANWKKDLFMGVMPNSQLGDIATVSLGTTADVVQLRGYTDPGDSATTVGTIGAGPNTMGQPNLGEIGLRPSGNLQTQNTIYLGINGSDVAPSSSFNILQLRMAEALQRYREVAQCSDQTYRDQIQAHFGVNLSAALSDKCMWIGGHVSNLNIDDVVNTNLSEGDTNIKGKGTASGQGFENFSCDEHGVLMCIYHAEPLLEYVRSGNSRELLYTDTTDLPFPEFDSIGMESVSILELFNSAGVFSDANDSSKFAFGYAPRYYELKTDVDDVCGAFTTTLQQWVAPINPAYLSEWLSAFWAVSNFTINYNWFKINPSVLDNIFIQKADSTWDSDQLWIAAYFDIKAVRNFDYDGMPY